MNTPVLHVTRLVGNTPMLDLSAWAQARGCRGRLFAKLELRNPSGSVKDRTVLYMLQDALRRGLVQPGGVVIEPSGGNTALKLLVVLKEGKELDEKAIRDTIAQKLEPYKMPKQIAVIDEIIKTFNGKIDRKQMISKYAQ